MSETTHIISIGLDDGFEKSSRLWADIYSKYGLKAEFNVIATGHHPDFEAPDEWLAASKIGDFKMWNELQDEGHSIMPHGYAHIKKDTLSFEQARKSILDCFKVFENELGGFSKKDSIFNFPNNVGTVELENWLSDEVMAFRCGIDGLNPFPNRMFQKITTNGYGPENCEGHLQGMVDQLLAMPKGWLNYCCHGLDGEGWGTMRSIFLDELLARLVEIPNLAILPSDQAFKYYSEVK